MENNNAMVLENELEPWGIEKQAYENNFKDIYVRLNRIKFPCKTNT